ncbi:YihY/virulence factor BrkB family protein [Pontibacillus yanchengensis]|uniref:Ribonuclease n=1 Tax=Pontibacillus yanchengensis Y32 TaxID=1385514 RepID=A0A0A2T8D7_9BACI|nr:YihY/virulence factor BrkB family protein [Pontibacillus yanchengensis]KGP72077.1 ribonuclease [Pontibacillus yanchengensis Y32]
MQKAIQFGKELIGRFTEHEVAGLAAQLAYFFLLAIFPFMIFLVALMGYLPISLDSLKATLDRYAPEAALELITNNLEAKNGSLLSVGIIGTLISASNGINAIMRAFNRAYEVGEDRSFLKNRFIAIVLTIAMLIVIVVALLLPVFGKAIGLYVFTWFGVSERFLAIWDALRWVISSGILILVLLSLYILAPNHHVNIKQALAGSVFATLFWQLASLGFSYYVSLSAQAYSTTYGSLGGIIILMLWFYLSGMIIIIGGEINAMLRDRKAFKP